MTIYSMSYNRPLYEKYGTLSICLEGPLACLNLSSVMLVDKVRLCTGRLPSS